MSDYVAAHGKCSICGSDLLWEQACIETGMPVMLGPTTGQVTLRRAFAHADHFTSATSPAIRRQWVPRGRPIRVRPSRALVENRRQREGRGGHEFGRGPACDAECDVTTLLLCYLDAGHLGPHLDEADGVRWLPQDATEAREERRCRSARGVTGTSRTSMDGCIWTLEQHELHQQRETVREELSQLGFRLEGTRRLSTSALEGILTIVKADMATQDGDAR